MEVDRRPTYALDKNFSVLKKNSWGGGGRGRLFRTREYLLLIKLKIVDIDFCVYSVYVVHIVYCTDGDAELTIGEESLSVISSQVILL